MLNLITSTLLLLSAPQDPAPEPRPMPNAAERFRILWPGIAADLQQCTYRLRSTSQEHDLGTFLLDHSKVLGELLRASGDVAT